MNNTTFDEVKDKFYSLIVTGEVLPEALVDEWLDSAIGEYELEVSELSYEEYEDIDETPIVSNSSEENMGIENDSNLPDNTDITINKIIKKRFTTRLSSAQKSLLGRYMQREFITRELSRFSKVTGIDSKDEKVSGLQATKITLRAELTFAETAIAELVSKLKELAENGK